MLVIPPLFFVQVGLPNVGKSTLFNTLTKMAIPAENFPFCTIEPNEARVNVPDERFEWLCQLYKPKSEVCTSYLTHECVHVTWNIDRSICPVVINTGLSFLRNP